MEKNKKIAYIVNSFPSIAQTYIIRELMEVRKKISVIVLSLTRPKHKKYPMHKQAGSLFEITFYFPGIFNYDFLRTIFTVFKNSKERFYYLWNHGRVNYLRTEKKSFIYGIQIFFKMIYYSEILAKKSIEHIHIHFATKETSFGAALAESLGITYSFTLHGRDLFLQGPESLIKKAKKAEFCVLGSEYTKKYFLEKTKISSEKVLMVYAGVNPDEYKYISCKEKRDILLKNNAIPNILTVGRIVEEKCYPHILGACRILKERGVKFIYNIIGKGSKKRLFILHNLCKKYDIEDCVKIHGALTMEQVKPFYDMADLFVLGSSREVIGVVLMEALSCGIPVVATNITGIPELIENNKNGILVPPKDEPALADAMERLLKDNDLADSFSKYGRSVIEEKFDTRITMKKLTEKFLELPQK